MKAITFWGKEDVRVTDVPKPTILRPTDALVKVTMAGLCGSDLHLYTEREEGLDKGLSLASSFSLSLPSSTLHTSLLPPSLPPASPGPPYPSSSSFS
jgi:threonine dehydrogenase-like Zn-dependent dehydrogenase